MFRFANDNDIDTIVKFVKDYAAEAGGWFFEIDEEGCREEAIRDIPNTIIVEDNGDAIGLLILEQVKIKWAKDIILIDKLLYVHPDHRKTGVGTQLLKEMKRIAEALKMKIMVTSFNGKDIERKEKLYEHGGFMKVGGVYIYEPKTLTSS